MFLYNVYRVGCEVSPLLLTHGSQCLGLSRNFLGNNLLFILIIPNFALWKKKCYAPWQLLFCLLKY